MKHPRNVRTGSLSCLIIAFFFTQTMLGQVKRRVIPYPEWSAPSAGEVSLEVVEIKVAGRPVTLDQSFEADGDWLRHLILTVKNVGKRPIVAFDIGGGLLGAIDEELPPFASFQYGMTWHFGLSFAEKEKAKGAALMPGASVELSYGNVSRLNREVLAKVAEGAFCKLKFMAPAIQYSDGAVESRGRIKF